MYINMYIYNVRTNISINISVINWSDFGRSSLTVWYGLWLKLTDWEGEQHWLIVPTYDIDHPDNFAFSISSLGYNEYIFSIWRTLQLGERQLYAVRCAKFRSSSSAILLAEKNTILRRFLLYSCLLDCVWIGNKGSEAGIDCHIDGKPWSLNSRGRPQNLTKMYSIQLMPVATFCYLCALAKFKVSSIL